MNKSELIASVAESTGHSKTKAGEVLETILETITKELEKGADVRLVGFGTFNTRQQKARTGRNPQTGKPIDIKAKTVPIFKAGQGLKDAVG